MNVIVTFGSLEEHGHYKSVEIEPTADHHEAILRGEAQLDNPEDWFWAFTTTEEDLNPLSHSELEFNEIPY